MGSELVKVLVDAGIGIFALAGILWAVVKLAKERTLVLLKILEDHAVERMLWYSNKKDKEL
jgi:hypothetical protein